MERVTIRMRTAIATPLLLLLHATLLSRHLASASAAVAAGAGRWRGSSAQPWRGGAAGSDACSFVTCPNSCSCSASSGVAKCSCSGDRNTIGAPRLRPASCPRGALPLPSLRLRCPRVKGIHLPSSPSPPHSPSPLLSSPLSLHTPMFPKFLLRSMLRRQMFAPVQAHGGERCRTVQR
ncbi:unnamed protein product, partial [Closterium sp. NIES-54]